MIWLLLAVLSAEAAVSQGYGCYNYYPECYRYNQAYCTHPTYQYWMKAFCKKFCGCSNTTDRPYTTDYPYWNRTTSEPYPDWNRTTDYPTPDWNRTTDYPTPDWNRTTDYPYYTTEYPYWNRTTSEPYPDWNETITKAPKCKDRLFTCYLMKKNCNGSFVQKYCPRTCGLCGTGGNTTEEPPVTRSPIQGKCGMVKVTQSRVVGGVDAKPGAWPWQAAMYYKKNSFQCGGSLINPNWIVTAAHCVDYGSVALNFTIKLGQHNRSREEGAIEYQIERIIMHPDYQKGARINNDIALIKLSKPALFSNRVQPVCLPKTGERPKVGSKCYITGWGKIKHPGKSHDTLQQLALTIQDNERCKEKNAHVSKVTEKMICGANTDVRENQSGCHGDSGGPFVCQQKDGSWKLHGAVSWGSWKCDIKHAFTVFARVAKFRSWIEENIRS